MSIKTIEETSQSTTTKSRKSRKANDSISLDTTALTKDPTSTPTEEVDNFSSMIVSKKSKRRKVDVDEGQAQSDALEDEKATKRTKRRSGEDEGVTGGTEATITDEKKTTKKRRKREKETTLDEDEPEQTKNAALDTSVELLGEKKKKRKKERASAENDEPSKKKKPKTGLPDPGEDTLLSDQARKALTYAYIQFDDPARWKFHKARQNWLIRNVWSDQIIPETYMPLLTRYLSDVKGGVRDNLITACKSILSQSSTASADPSPHLPADSKELVTNPKQLRARVVLDALT